MYGIKHVVKCRCVLSQLRNNKNPPNHQFVVFSIVENEVVKSTMVSCNNCGITHKITDLCKSEIIENSDEYQVINQADVNMCLPTDLREILDSYEVDLPTLQMSLWIIDSNKWGEKIILSKKELESRVEGKYLVFKGPNQYRIETFLEDKNEF